MTTRAEIFAGSFPAGPEWVAEARARLGLAGGDDEPIRAAAQGWMRLGSTTDATLVDTLFVLTDDRLGFGQTRFNTTDPNWVELSAVHALDLIEGVPYPLDSIEVQFVGGLAIFVGWPEEFTAEVLAVLRHNSEGPTMAPLFGPVASPGDVVADAFAAEADHAATAAVDDVSESPSPAGMFTVEDSDDENPFAEVFSPEELSDEQRSAEAAFFGHLEADDALDAPEDESVIEDDDLPSVPESAVEVTGPWDDPNIVWPDAFRDSAFLGGHPIYQRRRKTCTVVLERRGLVAATPRTGGWHIHIPWHAVKRLDVQGSDEIKFTHNQRVSSDGSVLVADLADGTTLLFEIRGKRPATLRVAVAPIQDAIDGAGARPSR